MKIGIVCNKKKPVASQLLPKIKSWLEQRKHQVVDTLHTPADQVIQNSKLVICLGGDGTLLASASHIKEDSAPVLGVNIGELGFLTEVKQNEVFDELEAFFQGRYKIEERFMIAGHVYSEKKGKDKHFRAMNDMVISREGLSRMVYIEVCVNGEKLTSFAGDGVIVATPTGSTAYSLSAGGSVVHPKLGAILITPICPHASALRGMVVSSDETIAVRLKPKGESAKALFTSDGQENLEIDDSYSIEITRSPVRLKLIKSSKRGYFATLREIFKFPS